MLLFSNDLTEFMIVGCDSSQGDWLSLTMGIRTQKRRYMEMRCDVTGGEHPRRLNSEEWKDQNRKLSTGQRSEVGKSRKTIENWITRSQRTKVLRMFSVSVPKPFRSLRTDRLWGTLHRVPYWDHPLSYDPCKDTPPPPMYDNNPCQLHRPLHQWSLPRSRLLGADKAWNCILCGQNPWPCQLQGVTSI